MRSCKCTWNALTYDPIHINLKKSYIHKVIKETSEDTNHEILTFVNNNFSRQPFGLLDNLKKSPS